MKYVKDYTFTAIQLPRRLDHGNVLRPTRTYLASIVFNM